MKLFFTSLLVFLGSFIYSQEICNNGIDDDADGLIDLQDTTDCFCIEAKFDSSVLSLIPNPSFESRTCCPTTLSQMACANTWVQASNATSDYFNTCGIQKIGAATFAFPPTPLPNGVGYVGFYNNNGYKEYVGTCLLDTLRIGISYQLQFYMAHSIGSFTTPIGLFATTSCANLPFGGPLSGNNCPTIVNPTWVLLDSVVVTTTATAWTVVTINFTPTQNYTAIVLGSTCSRLTGSNYYFADNLILNKTANFHAPIARIEDSGHYCQGNLVLQAKYDSLPKSFQWYKDSVAIVGETDSTYSVPNGGRGSYQVQLSYDSGCIITEVYVVDTTIITFDLDSAGSCPLGTATGEIIVSNVLAGTAPYEYKLNTTGFLPDSSFDQLSPGSYTVTVRDTNLCETTKPIIVEAFPMPVASFTADTVCLGQPTTFVDNSVIAKGSITQWEWNTPGNPTTQNTTYTYPTDGVYAVTHRAISDSGCIDDTTINVIVHPLPTADFAFSPIEIYTFNPDVCFSNLSTGAISYSWNFDFTGPTGTSTQTSPCTVRFPSDQEKTYRVKLIAISAEGCIDSTVINVIVLDEFILYVPNSFTPNEDNQNDELEIVTAGIDTYEIAIFNQWGEVIFASTDPTKFWDGKHDGQSVPTGTYVYKINVKGENGKVKEVIGHVNVLR